MDYRKFRAVTLLKVLFFFALSLVLPYTLCAQSADHPVRVAVRLCPPFVIKDSNAYSGISIFLWDKIAEELGLQYNIEEFDREELIESVAQGKADVAVSCLSITQDSEQVIDFSHAFFNTHLSIAVKQHGIMQSIKNVLFNKKLLIVIGIILAVAIFIGGTLFLLEHHVNEKLYSMKNQRGKLLEALITGLLFVTSGPIRYYEFRTLSGRTIAGLLAVGSTLMIASITALLASAFTLDQMHSEIKGPQDLVKVRVGAVRASPALEYLMEQGIKTHIFMDGEDMVAALDEGHLGAIVGEDAVLKYHIREAQTEGKYKSLSVLPFAFEEKSYGLALRDDNTLLETINQVLLSVRESPQWSKELAKYIGK